MPEEMIGLLVSACLGALVGLIRQWSEQQEHAASEETGLAGLRTFVLMAVLGYAAAFVGDGDGGITFAVVLFLVGAFMAAAQFRKGDEVRLGHTTFVASMLTFLVGGLVRSGNMRLAVAIAAGTMVVVGAKQATHEWTRRFTARDVRSALQFAAVTGVILPVFPDRGYGPFGALNPHSIWMMVVLISGLGFLGYILMRFLGSRAGILATGVVGGLASSTATTLAFSRKSREEPAMSMDCALSVALACVMMLVRVGILLFAISQSLAARCAPALLIMAAPAVIFVIRAWLVRRNRGEKIETPVLSNPLGLWTAIQFGALYAVVTVLVKATAHIHSQGGLFAVSFISGLTDMDAIALSVGNQVTGGAVDVTSGARAVVIGAVANTLVKGGMAMLLGAGVFRRSIGIVLGATALVGAAAMWLAM